MLFNFVYRPVYQSYIYTVSLKVPTFKLCQILTNLYKFLHCWKNMYGLISYYSQ